MTEHGAFWKPLPWQAQALASPAREVLLGGERASGKTSLLVAGAARCVDKPGHRALLLGRRDELEWLSRLLYEPMCAVFRRSDGLWLFPSGAAICLRDTSSALRLLTGRSFGFVGADNIDDLPRPWYWAIRALTGGEGAQLYATCEKVKGWLAEHFGPWGDGVAYFEAGRLRSKVSGARGPSPTKGSEV